ncbi:MAG: hypothetical protein ABSG03_16540 [Bryobacteraceae bacterium]|jgi:hypothetical protein
MSRTNKPDKRKRLQKTPITHTIPEHTTVTKSDVDTAIDKVYEKYGNNLTAFFHDVEEEQKLERKSSRLTTHVVMNRSDCT